MRFLEAWFVLMLLSPTSAIADEGLPEAQASLKPPEPELAAKTPEPELLAKALLATFPTFLKDAPTALRHSTAAVAAEAATGVPAEKLLAIPAIESNFDPTTISRRECRPQIVLADLRIRVVQVCDRVHGRWRRSATKPANVQGSYFCGLHQTGGAISWATCWRIIRDEPGSYLAAGRQLQTWFNDNRCRKSKGEARWECALWGYGGGYPLIKLGLQARQAHHRINWDSPLGYPRRVASLENLLRVKRARLRLTES